MTVPELIKKFNLVDAHNGNIQIRVRRIDPADLAEIKEKKPEILAFLRAEEDAAKAAAAERQAKIDGIEGLSELRAAISAREKFHSDFNRMMEDESNDGVFPPKVPTANIDELKAKYPRAAAYLRAESFYYATSDVKAYQGKKAMERILNGEDHAIVIDEMEKAWSDAAFNALMNS